VTRGTRSQQQLNIVFRKWQMVIVLVRANSPIGDFVNQIFVKINSHSKARFFKQRTIVPTDNETTNRNRLAEGRCACFTRFVNLS